jgi:hypothetical protein
MRDLKVLRRFFLQWSKIKYPDVCVSKRLHKKYMSDTVYIFICLCSCVLFYDAFS